MSKVFRSWLQGAAWATLIWSGSASAEVHIQLQRQTDNLVFVTFSGSIDPGTDDGFQFADDGKYAFFLNDIFGVQPTQGGPGGVPLRLGNSTLAVGGVRVGGANRFNLNYGLFGNSIDFYVGQLGQLVDLTVGAPFTGTASLLLSSSPETFAAIGSSGDITWGASPFTPEAGLGRGLKIGTWNMVSPVPEPANAALLLGGIAGLAGWLRRQRRHRAHC